MVLNLLQIEVMFCTEREAVIAIFNRNWNGIVVNTFLFVLAFGLVLPLKYKKKVNN